MKFTRLDSLLTFILIVLPLASFAQVDVRETTYEILPAINRNLVVNVSGDKLMTQKRQEQGYSVALFKITKSNKGCSSYYLQHVKTKKYIGVANGKIKLYSKPNDNTMWYISSTYCGSKPISDSNNPNHVLIAPYVMPVKTCLDVYEWRKTPGGIVDMYKKANSLNQRFYLQETR